LTQLMVESAYGEIVVRCQAPAPPAGSFEVTIPPRSLAPLTAAQNVVAGQDSWLRRTDSEVSSAVWCHGSAASAGPAGIGTSLRPPPATHRCVLGKATDEDCGEPLKRCQGEPPPVGPIEVKRPASPTATPTLPSGAQATSSSGIVDGAGSAILADCHA